MLSSHFVLITFISHHNDLNDLKKKKIYIYIRISSYQKLFTKALASNRDGKSCEKVQRRFWSHRVSPPHRRDETAPQPTPDIF